MAKRETVGSIRWPYNYGSGDAEGPEFIQCVYRRDHQIHEIWDFGSDGVTREVNPTVRVDVGAVFVGEFSTDYLTEIWRRVPMLGRNSINGSLQWLGVPDLLSIDGPAWTTNLLAPHPSWGDGGSSTNSNWGSQSIQHSDSVSVSWNRPVCVFPYYHRKIFENT